MNLTPDLQAFYEWYDQNAKMAVSTETQREIFLAGWNARASQDAEV